MKLERIVLLLSALAILGAFFLPYLHFESPLGEVQVSGYSLVETGLDIAKVSEKPGGDILMDFVGKFWQEAADAKDLAALAGIVLVCLGPVFFALFALGYLIRALIGKQYKRGIFFLLVYVAASWAIMYFVGKNYGIEAGFFSMTGPGFWVGAGGMLTAAFSLFFAKNLE